MYQDNMAQDNWEVPSYDISFTEEKNKKYCVVVPIINEGERILTFLKKMQTLKIFNEVDIILMDGGSTDGSTQQEQLKKLNVNTLLIKTGPGKLSAQLRCAYAYALQQGYEGIITIDGNNKDDPAEIPLFIKALDQGIDFAQGSRFIKGGKGINTPGSRHFAIKYIHAPLLSFFSGFKWTDTTQGFRAYSKKMLISKEIAAFRDVFDTYELLAYLSYRAPKLGFSCKELPTSRIYPKGEVPTKISSFSGNILVFKILIKACLGFYNHRSLS